MKTQIRRLSPHQNAKVMAVLMAISALVFAIPMFFVFLNIHPGLDSHGRTVTPPPAWMPLLFPVLYLIMGYVMTIIGCWVYNFIVRYVGGIEYETGEEA